MKILFDHGTPAPLRHALRGHVVTTAYEKGWAQLENGDLLEAADKLFDVFVTTDKNLRHQQNLSERRIAILVLPTANWPRLREQLTSIVNAVEGLTPGSLIELDSEQG